MIRARGVRFAFPGRPVLEDITIEIQESLTTVIVGRSGIGKSVFLKCITGLLHPQSGSITIDGNHSGRPERNKARDHGCKGARGVSPGRLNNQNATPNATPPPRPMVISQFFHQPIWSGDSYRVCQ